MKQVYINAIATCVPQYECLQDDVRDFMFLRAQKKPLVQSFIRKVYQGTGIKKRYSVLPDFCSPSEAKLFFTSTKGEPTTLDRNNVFCLESPRLAQSATEKLFSLLPDFDLKTITHLITLSCTGFCAPGFDCDLVKNLNLPLTIHRFHLGFMGCFAAFPALKLAKSLCLAQNDARVLIVGVELCSLHFQTSWDSEAIVANSLFGDGASCALVSCEPSVGKESGFILHDFNSQIIPNSEKALAWIIGEKGFHIRLSSYVPSLIETHINSILKELFIYSGWSKKEVDLWAIHPGGRVIVDKVATALNLSHNDLSITYDTLRNYGNMSSVTIFFILKRLTDLGKKGKLFSCAFGPGLTVESALMESI